MNSHERKNRTGTAVDQLYHISYLFHQAEMWFGQIFPMASISEQTVREVFFCGSWNEKLNSCLCVSFLFIFSAKKTQDLPDKGVLYEWTLVESFNDAGWKQRVMVPLQAFNRWTRRSSIVGFFEGLFFSCLWVHACNLQDSNQKWLKWLILQLQATRIYRIDLNSMWLFVKSLRFFYGFSFPDVMNPIKNHIHHLPGSCRGVQGQAFVQFGSTYEFFFGSDIICHPIQICMLQLMEVWREKLMKQFTWNLGGKHLGYDNGEISTVMFVFLVNVVRHSKTFCCFRYHRANHMLGETGTAHVLWRQVAWQEFRPWE